MLTLTRGQVHKRVQTIVDHTPLPFSAPARAIVEAVSAEHGVSVAEMIGPQQGRDICRARHHAMWSLYRTGRYSLPKLGRMFGGRDHTTVLAALRRHEGRVG